MRFIALLLLGSSLLAVAKSPDRIDPAAIAPLKRMSQTLADASAFSFRSRTIFEVPAENGQFITMFSTGEVTLKRPNKLRAELRGSAPHLDFYYDGESVSAFAPGPEFTSTKSAPDTIDAMLAGLQEETGIRFASLPLLKSDPYGVLTRGLLSAISVGRTEVDGALCDHLAFRSPGVNWEIWLEANEAALPRRMAITFTDVANFPRTMVEYSGWNLHPLFLTDSSFVFRKPQGAKEIPFASVLKSADR